MHRLIYILLLFPSLLLAQERVTSDRIERESYQQFKDGDWKPLIKTVKTGLKNDVDYFYLRIRLGIAYYNMKKYRLAEKEFRKAMDFDGYDLLNKEYLYYSYLQNESYELSRKLTKSFDSSMRLKTSTAKLANVPLFYAEGGTKRSDNQSLFSNARYFQVGLSHSVGRNIMLGHAYTNYKQISSFGDISQNQYYVQAQIPVFKTWLVSPAFHLLNFELNKEVSYVPNHPPNLPDPPARTRTNSYTENNYLISLSVKKTTSLLDIIPSVSYSKIDQRNQYQGSLQLNAYPFGSNKFSVGASGMLQKDSSLWKNGYKIHANYMPSKRFKINGSYYRGNMLDYNEDNGYLINNSYYCTNYKISLIPEWSVSKKLSIYAILQQENKSQSNGANNFNYTTIMLGLKLKSF